MLILNRAEEVLIETLWNVKNLIEIGGTGHGLGINRNIVECKVSACEVTIGAMSAVLIETLWNVKQDQDYFLSSSE